MTDTVAVLTPVTQTDAVELGRTLYRKQVLAHGDYAYGGRTLKFTPEYTAKVAQSFRDKAYDTVPFMLADRDNAHTMDPTRARGTVEGLEATPDGLDALISLTDDAAAIVKDHPNFGVSVRLLENLERADGKSYPVALNHVLGTFDPRLTGMKPWQQVQLSNDDATHVLDLTTLTDAPAEPGAHQEAAVPALTDTLTDDELTKLRKLLAADEATPAPAPAAPAVDEYVKPDDATLDAIAKGLLEDTTPAPVAESTPAPAAELSNDAGHAIDLANARADRLEVELSRLQAESDERAYNDLRRQVAEAGLPPYVTDLAKPLLLGRHTVDLANGAQVDAGDVMRKVLMAAAEAKHLDLSSGGVVYDQTEQDKAAATFDEAQKWAAEHRKTLGR